MQLNDWIAVTMLQTKFMDDYIDYDSYAGVYMSDLLFPLTCVFSDDSKIMDSKVYLYVSVSLNYYHVEYYR